jgi:hypothetical protein
VNSAAAEAWDSGHAYEQYVGRWSRKVAMEFLRWLAPYVWDYAGGMQMMRHFWDAAIAVSPDDAKLDQAERFPLCQPGPLQALFERVGLKSVTLQAIDIPTVFQDFDDYWTPFLGRTGAARAIWPRSPTRSGNESGSASNPASRRRAAGRSS